MKIGKSDITHFLLGHVWSCDTVRLIVCGQKHLMDYYDYFMTKHNILHFSGFKRWESSRGDNSLKRYQKPYSCLTYFHVMFLMIPALTKVKVWVWYGKLWTINPFTPKISLVILLTISHTVLVMSVWRIWYWINL